MARNTEAPDVLIRIANIDADTEESLATVSCSALFAQIAVEILCAVESEENNPA